jgi:toxin ParE1/3/4
VSTRRLIFHPGVEEDLADVVAYYGEIDPSLAGRLRLRFLEQVERVELYPESGAILFDSYRRVVLQRFPYMVVYLVGEERIDVLAVLNVRRDPTRIEDAVTGRADA